MDSKTSFITTENEQDGKDFVRSFLNDLPDEYGNQMIIKLFLLGDNFQTITDINGVEKKIHIPDEIKSLEVLRTAIAVVLGLGPECYVGERYEKSGPWCKVGDFIFFPRNEGRFMVYKGISVHTLQCDKFYCVIQDPNFITWERK